MANLARPIKIFPDPIPFWEFRTAALKSLDVIGREVYYSIMETTYKSIWNSIGNSTLNTRSSIRL